MALEYAEDKQILSNLSKKIFLLYYVYVVATLTTSWYMLEQQKSTYTENN